MKITLTKTAILVMLMLFLSNLCHAEDKKNFFTQKEYIPDIETFIQIGYAGNPKISPDGETVFFTSGISGVSQIYKLEKNLWPYQLTHLEEGISDYSLSPDGVWIVFLASTGGDEQDQLYLMNARTGRFEKLTASPDVQFGYPVFSPDGEKIYFRSNEENKKDFYIYSLELKTRKKELIFKNAGFNTVSDISPGGDKLMAVRSYSNQDSDIFLIDLKTKDSKKITYHKDSSLFDYALFTKNPDEIILLTNKNKDGVLKIAKMDLKKFKIDFLYDTQWEAEEVAISPDRSLLAWTINEEGYGKLKIMNLTEKKLLKEPALDGIISSPYFSANGVIVFSFTSADLTMDVYKWDIKDSGLGELTSSSYAGINKDLFIKPKLIKYTSFDGLKIPAFLFLPKNYKGGPIPFIIHAHGGPEAQFRPYFQRHFQYLLLNGYGILAPNVRGSSGYGKLYKNLDNYKKRKDSVKDYYYAAKWLVENHFTKPELLGIKGASYGGYIVLACLTDYPDMFSAGVDEVGISDFVNFLKNTKSYRKELREAEYGPLADEAFLSSISPINYIYNIKTPLLIIHGQNDPRVPVSEALNIINALKEKNIPAESLIFPDEGHGVSKRKNSLILYRKMVDFFDNYLKGIKKNP